jgi:hypothetical protein
MFDQFGRRLIVTKPKTSNPTQFSCSSNFLEHFFKSKQNHLAPLQHPTMGNKNSKQAKRHHQASRQPPASGCEPLDYIQQQHPVLNHSTVNNKTSKQFTRKASTSSTISSPAVTERHILGPGDPWVCCWDRCQHQNPVNRTSCRKCSTERSKLRKKCPTGQCSKYGGHIKGKYQILGRF